MHNFGAICQVQDSISHKQSLKPIYFFTPSKRAYHCVLFYVFEQNSTTIYFLVCDKPNIFILTRLYKFASVRGKVVYIY